MKRLLMIALLVLLALGVMPVNAQTITMSNPGNSNTRDVIVYLPNGTMWGFYNDTSVITLDQNESYIFTLKPIFINPISDPTEWFTNVFIPWIKANALILIVIGFLIMLYRKGR